MHRPPSHCTPRSSAVVELTTPEGVVEELDIFTQAANLDPNPALGLRDNVAPTQHAVKTYVDGVAAGLASTDADLAAAIAALQDVVASDDPDLNTVQEIVDYIKGLGLDDESVAGRLAIIEAILATTHAGLNDLQEIGDAIVALQNAVGSLVSNVSDHGDRLTALESVVAVDDPDFDTLQEVVDYLKALNVATYTASTTPPTNTQIPWYDTSDGTWSVFDTVSGTWVSTVLPPLPAP